MMLEVSWRGRRGRVREWNACGVTWPATSLFTAQGYVGPHMKKGRSAFANRPLIIQGE